MTEIQTNSPGFFARLKQHHIYRVVAAYAVGAWIVMQAATRVFPYFGWSGAVPILIIILLLGFPVVLVIAWMLIKSTDSAKFDSWQRRYWKLGAALSIAVVILVVISGFYAWRFSKHHTQLLTAVATNRQTTVPASASSVPPATTVVPAKSIAVLPFENLSTDKANAYFADGMQDLILTKLADIGDLKVISRTSTMQYGSHPQNLKIIAMQLGVAAILEGSVQKAGNQVLINAQLIDAATDQHLWAEAYTRTLNNIFGVEGEVAQKVAVALKATLTQAETERVASVSTQNVAAYDSFLQGEYYFHRAQRSYLKSDFEAAIRNYREAIRQDPKFALAWAKLAIEQTHLLYQYGDDDTKLPVQIKAAVDRALALAPNLAESHLAQGWYRDHVLNDPEGALASFNAALAMKPQNADVLFSIGVIHQNSGQWDASIKAFQHASALDPRNIAVLNQLAVSYMFLRRYTLATQLFKQALAIDPASAIDVFELVELNFFSGDLDGAAAVLGAPAPQNVRDNPLLTEEQEKLLFYRRDYAAARKLFASVKPAGTFSAVDIEIDKGDLEWAAGDRTLAREYYLRVEPSLEAALRQNPDVLRSHETLGWIYARLSRNREALNQGELAVKLDPIGKYFIGGTGALLNMAQIQAQVGNIDEAIAGLDHLLAIPAGGWISVPLLQIDPTWDPVRKDPGFQALLKKYENSNQKPETINGR